MSHDIHGTLTYDIPQTIGAVVSFAIQDKVTILPSLAYTGVETYVNCGTT